jgi:cytidyltransferase-like protein
MNMIVIMPGGFHPFHAGHASLYQSALKAFPNADVYVAATNDTKTRPFPFEIKEKLAKVAGVKDGRFVQVTSPFQAKEILQNYNPEEDVVVFVRSEKDRDENPKPGGTKKDGSPAYFQPYTGKDMQPFSKHGYMAYLPTVEFGPGIKSATEIRNIWPKLDDRRKLAMVMSLYPKAKENQRLAQNIVKMLDIGMGTEEVNETGRPYNPDGKTYRGTKNKMPTLGPDPAQDAEPLSSLSGSYEMDTKPIELAKLRKFIKSRLDLLDERESQIIISRFGLDGEEPMTLMQLANVFNTNPERIRQIEARVMRKLKHISTSRPLRAFDMALNEESENLYSARQAHIFKDLGDGYYLGDDSYDDDDGFVKKGYTVYYQEGDDQYREVSNVSMSPYSNPPGHVENEIRKIIISDRNNLSESIDYLSEK